MNKHRARILRMGVGAVSVLVVFCSTSALDGQPAFLSELQSNFRRSNTDSSRLMALGALVDYYSFDQFDSSMYYSGLLIDLANRINDPYGIYLGYFGLFHAYNCRGNYPKALEADFEMQKAAISLSHRMPWLPAVGYYFQGVLFRENNDYLHAIEKFHEALELVTRTHGDITDMFGCYTHAALIYRNQGKMDSAIYSARKGYELAARAVRYRKFFCLANAVLGNIYASNHNLDSAFKYYRAAILESKRFNNIYFLARSYNFLATLYQEINQHDSCIFYARTALGLCLEHDFGEFAYDASVILKNAFQQQKNADSALKYIQIMLVAKDSVFSQSQEKKFQQVVFQDELSKQQAAAEELRQAQRKRIYLLTAGSIFLLLLTIVFYFNYRQKRKANAEIAKSYRELKNAQARLVQSEKMASLGELTAGIAHEIQNPLNFVNNFSEVNKELAEELKSAALANDIGEVIVLADLICANEDKIMHHGKRADVIIKGMLEHSRGSSGKKEPADLNALADDYLKLSYHGFRAKNNDFTALLHTDYDPGVGKIAMVSQEIGRVLLNLYNNAFYAICEKQQLLGNKTYQPALSVHTKKTAGHVEITVRDNGAGIPQHMVEKIFQPFYTTKPTGQGTGLGLSISYDIVRAHGGEITAATTPGEGSAFTVSLPLTD